MGATRANTGIKRRHSVYWFALAGGVLLSPLLLQIVMPAIADDQVRTHDSKELRLRRLVIEDSEGTDRIAIGTNDGQPFILLLDAKQRPRLQLSVLSDGSTGLHFYNDARDHRVELAALPDGTSQLILTDKDARLCTAAVSPDAVSGFGLYDKQKRTIVGLLQHRDDARNLVIADKKQHVRATVGVSREGVASISVTNKNGKRKVLRQPAE